MKTKSVKKSRRAVIWIAAAAALVVVGFFLLPLFEKPEINAVDGSADWMKELSDDILLNEITLPGTHDSASSHVQLATLARCQSRSIAEQLSDGFRYLDIRLAADSENNGRISLVLTHGSSFCRKKASPSSGKLYLDNVLAQCYTFLDLHPHETVLFAVSQERGDESISTFENLLYTYVSQDPDYWLLTDRIPTLGEARGKLVLLRRYMDEAGLGTDAGISFFWKDQAGFEDPDLNCERNSAEGLTLWVQDRYEFDNDEKWAAFVSTISSCPADIAGGELCLNFLSTKGTMIYGHPYSHAKALNEKFSALSLDPGHSYGWIILDFGTPELARNIYSANFVPEAENIS